MSAGRATVVVGGREIRFDSTATRAIYDRLESDPGCDCGDCLALHRVHNELIPPPVRSHLERVGADWLKPGEYVSIRDDALWIDVQIVFEVIGSFVERVPEWNRAALLARLRHDIEGIEISYSDTGPSRREFPRGQSLFITVHADTGAIEGRSSTHESGKLATGEETSP